MQAEEPSLSCKKISATTSAQISSHLTPKIAIPLIIMCEAQLIKKD